MKCAHPRSGRHDNSTGGPTQIPSRLQPARRRRLTSVGTWPARARISAQVGLESPHDVTGKLVNRGIVVKRGIGRADCASKRADDGPLFKSNNQKYQQNTYRHSARYTGREYYQRESIIAKLVRPSKHNLVGWRALISSNILARNCANGDGNDCRGND